MSLPRLGRTGRGTIPSGILCPISWCGRCVSDDLTRAHEVTDGEANRGKRKGQSVWSDPAKKGFTLDVGLLVGARAALYSASRAGDGIRTREYLLGNRVTLSSPAPLAFP
jgi:hypothetical protein